MDLTAADSESSRHIVTVQSCDQTDNGEQQTLKCFFLKAGDSAEINRDSEEHVEIMETYDPGPAAKKQKCIAR